MWWVCGGPNWYWHEKCRKAYGKLVISFGPGLQKEIVFSPNQPVLVFCHRGFYLTEVYCSCMLRNNLLPLQIKPNQYCFALSFLILLLSMDEAGQFSSWPEVYCVELYVPSASLWDLPGFSFPLSSPNSCMWVWFPAGVNARLSFHCSWQGLWWSNDWSSMYATFIQPIVSRKHGDGIITHSFVIWDMYFTEYRWTITELGNEYPRNQKSGSETVRLQFWRNGENGACVPTPPTCVLFVWQSGRFPLH